MMYYIYLNENLLFKTKHSYRALEIQKRFSDRYYVAIQGVKNENKRD
jgi:hypothetical protein